jgi:exosome complex component RRP45
VFLQVREPLALSIHHLPIAVTFGFLGDGDLLVLDPSLKEELVMGGRLTITINTHGEVCAVQKGGGVGVSASELMRCLRLASTKAAVLTEMLKKVVSFCHPSLSNSVCNKHFPLLRLFC